MSFNIKSPTPFKFKHPKTGKEVTLGSGEGNSNSEDSEDLFRKLKKSRAVKVIVGIAVVAVSAKVVIYFINEGAELIKAAKKLEKACNS